MRESFFLWLAGHLPRSRYSDAFRWRLLKLAGMGVDQNDIRAPFNFTQVGQLHRISIGRSTFLNAGCRIGVAAPATVSIGANCAIGPYVQFETMSHELVWTPERRWGGTAASIVVGDRCWIGARAVILGGVVIGEGCVVAAGAVVTKDVEPNTLVGGVPAKVIRRLH